MRFFRSMTWTLGKDRGTRAWKRKKQDARHWLLCTSTSQLNNLPHAVHIISQRNAECCCTGGGARAPGRLRISGVDLVLLCQRFGKNSDLMDL